MEKQVKIKQKDIVRDVKTIDRRGVLKDRARQKMVQAKDELTGLADRAKDEVIESASGDRRSRPAETYALGKAEDGVKQTITSSGRAITGQIKGIGQRRRDAKKTGGLARKQKPAKTTNAPKTQASVMRRERQAAAGKASLAARMRGKAVRDHAAIVAKRAMQKRVAARNAKAAAAAFVRSVKLAIAAMKSLIMAIAAGGAAAVVAIILIIVIALILASALAIFFSNDIGEGLDMREAVIILTDEFSVGIDKIIEENEHDELEMVYVGGDVIIDWKSVVAVYAVKTSEGNDSPVPVLVLDDENLGRLRSVFNDMNSMAFKTRTETRTRTVTEIIDGETVQREETYTSVILTITITRKSVSEMAVQYGFSKSQNETLAELMKPEYDDLWVQLIGEGAFRDSDGERRQPSPDRKPKGIFSWPLETPGIVTSWFGWRVDPTDGVTRYHEGIDIGASYGTPILAAASGTVSFSNSADSYGGGYGYYVMIRHGGGYETLYAHCSAVAVRTGASVSKGQIIGYVGSTGKSTGNHLHWEIYKNGSRVDPLSYFE